MSVLPPTPWSLSVNEIHRARRERGRNAESYVEYSTTHIKCTRRMGKKDIFECSLYYLGIMLMWNYYTEYIKCMCVCVLCFILMEICKWWVQKTIRDKYFLLFRWFTVWNVRCSLHHVLFIILGGIVFFSLLPLLLRIHIVGEWDALVFPFCVYHFSSFFSKLSRVVCMCHRFIAKWFLTVQKLQWPYLRCVKNLFALLFKPISTIELWYSASTPNKNKQIAWSSQHLDID